MRKLITFFATCVATFLFANHAFPNELHDAIVAERYDLVTDLAQNHNLAEQDNKGNTPLLLAVSQNNLKIVEILIKVASSRPSASTTHASDIIGLNVLNQKKQTALSCATTPEMIYQLTQLDENLLPQLIQNPWVATVLRNDIDGFTALLSTLKDTDFELDLMDPGQTLLHWMAICKNFSFVNYFNHAWIIESINAQNSQGNTPLHYAAANGNMDHISLLLSFGANASTANNDGKTPYDLALKYGYTEAADLLPSGISNQDNSPSEASSAASSLQDTDAAAGAASAYDNKLSRPLFQATGSNKIERVRELLEEKADPNAKYKSQLTPIFTAIFNGNVEIVQLLLNNGADVNAIDEFGNTPLLWALIHCKFSPIIELLLDYGADVSTTGPNGDTPLSVALTQNRPTAIILRLLKNNLKLTSRELEAASDYIKKNAPQAKQEHANLLATLFPNNTASVTPTPRTSKTNHDHMLFRHVGLNEYLVVYDLIANGANPNARNKSQQTPIFTAIFNGNVEIVQLLLDNGADVNAIDEFGNTPLLWALTFNINIEIINLLLDRGADVNARHINGNTPLYLALVNDRPHEIINLLHADRHRLSKQEIEAKLNYYKRNPLPVTENNNLPTSSLPNSTAPEAAASFEHNPPTPYDVLPFVSGGSHIR